MHIKKTFASNHDYEEITLGIDGPLTVKNVTASTNADERLSLEILDGCQDGGFVHQFRTFAFAGGEYPLPWTPETVVSIIVRVSGLPEGKQAIVEFDVAKEL